MQALRNSLVVVTFTMVLSACGGGGGDAATGDPDDIAIGQAPATVQQFLAQHTPGLHLKPWPSGMQLNSRPPDPCLWPAMSAPQLPAGHQSRPPHPFKIIEGTTAFIERAKRATASCGRFARFLPTPS